MQLNTLPKTIWQVTTTTNKNYYFTTRVEARAQRRTLKGDDVNSTMSMSKVGSAVPYVRKIVETAT